MRLCLAVSAAVIGAAALAAPEARAQSACLLGGDASAELACGLSGYSAGGAPARPDRNAAAPSRITSGRASGEVVSPSDRAAPSRITSPGGYRPAARPALPEPYEYRAEAGGGVYPPSAGAIVAAPLDPLQAPPAPPAASSEFAYAYAPPQGDHIAWRGEGARAAPPPPPAAPGGQVTAQGAGPAPSAPSTYGYSYETAEGAAFAWRYETPSGPAWAYAYDTPEGRAYAWAYEPPAPDLPVYEAREHHAPPPAHHKARHAPPPDPGPPPFHLDWRYADELRLYGRSFPRLLVIAETWYREGQWVTVDRRPLNSGCHTCLSPAPGPVYGPVGGSGGGIYFGGGGGGFASAAARAEAEAAARAGFSNRSQFEVSAQSAAYAEATGPNGNAVSGTPFAFPGGWPGAQ